MIKEKGKKKATIYVSFGVEKPEIKFSIFYGKKRQRFHFCSHSKRILFLRQMLTSVFGVLFKTLNSKFL
jgi:hypothetical protein